MNVPYRDVARCSEDDGGGIQSITRIFKGLRATQPIYAPPIIHDTERDIWLSQLPVILMYLAEKYGMFRDMPTEQKWRIQQRLLTALDIMVEAHDTHHPVSKSLYFEDQIAEAKIAAGHFLSERLPNYLKYFEVVLKDSASDFLASSTTSVADIAWIHTHHGLRFAFPKAMATLDQRYPMLSDLTTRVSENAHLQTYMQSGERLAFNAHGLFRAYPELDHEPEPNGTNAS